MQIEQSIFGDVVVLELRGKITLGEGDDLLKDKTHSLLQQGVRKFVISLEHVPYIDSAGNGELTRTYTAINRQGGALILVHPSERIFDLLSITKLRTVYDIVPSINDGVAVFQSTEQLDLPFEADCPVCPLGKARFRMREFFDPKNCVVCGVTFQVIEPRIPLVDAISTSTVARLSRAFLPTYRPDGVRVWLGGRCTIEAPRRLDLFSVEALEKAWAIIPRPRSIVLDVANVETFTEVAINRLLELSASERTGDRSVYVTQKSGGPPSLIADRLRHTGRVGSTLTDETYPQILLKIAHRSPGLQP